MIVWLKVICVPINRIEYSIRPKHWLRLRWRRSVYVNCTAPHCCRCERTFTPFTCTQSYTGHKFALTEMWEWDRHNDARTGTHTQAKNITFIKIKRNDPLSTLLYWASQKNRKTEWRENKLKKMNKKKKRMVRKCKVKRKELNEKTAMAKEPRDSKGKCWIPFFSFYLNVNVCAFTGPHSDVEYTHVLTTTYYTWIFLSCFPFTFSLLTKLLQYFSHSSINYYNRNKRIFWTLTYNFACRTP